MTTSRIVGQRDIRSSRLVVDGVAVEATVDAHLLDEVLLPELQRLAEGSPSGRRTFVFLVAPPGAGKSTLAALLRHRAGLRDLDLDLDVVGLDGFHFPNSYLASHHHETGAGRVPLSSLKGAPETFDVAALSHQLDLARTEDLCWPAYDRTLHDVVPGREPVTAGLVIIEGNWLLLEEPGWAGLAAHSAFTIFIEADPDQLRQRLIDRKVRGGMSRAGARDFYERSDRLNVQRVLTHSDRDRVDLLLALGPDGTTHRKATP